MGARTGQQFLEQLRTNPPNLWVHGQKVQDPTTHPATRGMAQTMAELLDMQHDPKYRDILTYVSPISGSRVGLSFLQTRSLEDLKRRAAMHSAWSDYCLGFLGRLPDYMNVNLMAAANAADYFSENDPRFGENIRRYYETVRENDLVLTHALTNPQVNRSTNAAGLKDPYIALGVVSQDGRGIVVRGARMMATLPIADEILIFPSTVLKEQEDMAPYALAFAVPTNTPGVHFQCREAMDHSGLGAWDHPLSSRFEEFDAMVIFDDVLVPWERVFLLGDVKKCNRAYAETGAVLHMAHQVICGKVAKTEAILGVSQSVVDAIGAGEFQHVQGKIAEIIIQLEVMKALKQSAEDNGGLDRWGTFTPARAPLDAARNLYPQVYPKLVEILQLLAASGLIMIPTQSDFAGPMGDHLRKYLQGASVGAEDKVQLMRLAWDMTISSFGARQTLYERFFFGDPVRTQQALYSIYDKRPAMEKVRRFLERGAARQVEESAAD
ncbi:MAG: 4-hydroxyphenylacetate 3-monooxygenase, oxygenase component [Meiothermus sp.]|nr:4-hydroxyphenylacetate 3-monooxygenase, oxygenase component [Meiothermus sp.]